VFDRNLVGLGLDRSEGTWLLVGLLLPLAYALPVYLLVWRSGLGGFGPARWRTGVPYLGDPGDVVSALALLLTIGLLDKLARALGEEIGWRGFLVPELMKHMSLWKVGVVSGLIWTAYHMPLIIFGSYNSSSHGGPPITYQIACFTVMVTSMGIFFAWLRVASQSVWPCALLHASHNLLIQSILDRATVKGPTTAYVIGEFGFGLALTCFAVALLVLAGYRH
jgi:membrane protease YdiL (CAAX protease family)